jgi:hypothetical protein
MSCVFGFSVTASKQAANSSVLSSSRAMERGDCFRNLDMAALFEFSKKGNGMTEDAEYI